LQQLVQLQPNDYTYHIRLAQLALKRGDTSIFNHAINRALELKPGCIDALSLQFKTLYEAGKYTRILEIYNAYFEEPQFDELIVDLSRGQKSSDPNLRMPEFIRGIPVDGKFHQFRFALYGFDELVSTEVCSFQIKFHETGAFAHFQNIFIESDSAGHRFFYQCRIDSSQLSETKQIWTLKSPCALKPSDTIAFTISVQKPLSPQMAAIIAGSYRRMGLENQLKDFIEHLYRHYHSDEFVALQQKLRKSINYGGA